MTTLRQDFAKLTPPEWNRNLYYSWLYGLKTLSEPCGPGYQAFQQTDAWTDRQLNTALASWAALRHDTILYAKQSYTPRAYAISVPPIPPPPNGLVEPLPKFIARMLATAQMAQRGLEDMQVLNEPAQAQMEGLVAVMERLLDICRRQVANEALRPEDNAFLGSFAETLKGTVGEVDEKGLRTTLIADVHTDLNTQQCLQEASGNVDLVVVAYQRPEGDIVLLAGPVLSYYEFRQPITDRLTDEQWRDMLSKNTGPARPTWNSSYSALPAETPLVH
jgi:hypothetical protein